MICKRPFGQAMLSGNCSCLVLKDALPYVVLFADHKRNEGKWQNLLRNKINWFTVFTF